MGYSLHMAPVFDRLRQEAASLDESELVVRRFPFRLLYVIRGDFVVVAAVAHTSRSIETLLRRR